MDGLPMLNCLLQHTLRSLCSCSDSSSSSKWIYAVFWRILPRNYPPPKWEFGGGAIDRAKGNKRNWILVWEDGFCDFHGCERSAIGDNGYMKGRFGPDIFFKMSHEVYNYGEGLVGKVAADNSHKWVFREISSESDTNFISSWNMTIDPQPKAWDVQFNSGIQTIAIISVREGIVQLGSLDKMVEDLNLVISIQRKFSYLQSIPGVFAMQRPYLPIQHPYVLKPNNQIIETHEALYSVDDKCQVIGAKRLFDEMPDNSSVKSINLGWNSPQNGFPGASYFSMPSNFPNMSCSLGAILSKLPFSIPFYSTMDAPEATFLYGTSINNECQRVKLSGVNGMSDEVPIAAVKVEPPCHLDAIREDNPRSTNCNVEIKDQVVAELGIQREDDCSLNLN